jgi:hypothetical protein
MPGNTHGHPSQQPQQPRQVITVAAAPRPPMAVVHQHGSAPGPVHQHGPVAPYQQNPFVFWGPSGPPAPVHNPHAQHQHKP